MKKRKDKVTKDGNTNKRSNQKIRTMIEELTQKIIKIKETSNIEKDS